MGQGWIISVLIRAQDSKAGWGMTIIPASWEGKQEDCEFEASLGKNGSEFLSQKQNESKKVGGVTQVVERLPDMQEAGGSILSTARKKIDWTKTRKG
jgi:hypothetical protein